VSWVWSKERTQPSLRHGACVPSAGFDCHHKCRDAPRALSHGAPKLHEGVKARTTRARQGSRTKDLASGKKKPPPLLPQLDSQ
jgi:hypothetical protein